MAGALNNGSTNFKRMLSAGLTAAIIIAVIQAYLNYTISLALARQMAQDYWANDPVMAIVTNFVPSIALGVIVPILAKVMTWYGIQPQRTQPLTPTSFLKRSISTSEVLSLTTVHP